MRRADTLEILEETFLLSSLPVVEATLRMAGYTHDQALMRKSISFYRGLIYFYEKEEDFGTDRGCIKNIIISSDDLKQYCFWE